MQSITVSKQRRNRSQVFQANSGARSDVPRWKRILDVCLILITAPVWVPLMFVIGVMIKLLSPGPVLFRQQRVGLHGTPFVCLKFRTMHTAASTSAHERHLAELMRSNRPMTKLDGYDPRLIPLGAMLRSAGLDELPQLFNVLRGDMSLVGPRPCTLQEYEVYSRPQRARSGTLPGLTGLWQVNGKNDTTFNEMIELDIRYVNTLCLSLDLGIMLRTPAALLTQIAETIRHRNRGASPSGDTSGSALEGHNALAPVHAKPTTHGRRPCLTHRSDFWPELRKLTLTRVGEPSPRTPRYPLVLHVMRWRKTRPRRSLVEPLISTPGPQIFGSRTGQATGI